MKKIRIFFTAMVLTLVSLAAQAQNIQVKGTVKDQAGEPIVGANVVLQGSTRVYTLTDADGAFSLNVPADGVLDVTCMGYQAQSVGVNGKGIVNVVLTDDSQLLEETIVVAFGTATKESFTGSAKVLDSDVLANSQVSAVTSALVGQVAGVQLSQSNGAPGSTPSIRIRGFSSITAGKEPLYVVDGMPYDGDINNINPADVESMTVLKDAASNALYGARGANGVIMITTKKAKERNAVITLDAKVGVNQRALQNYDLVTDPAQYYEMHYGALYDYYTTNGVSPTDAFLRANSNLFADANNGGLGYNVYTYPEGQSLIGVNGKLNPNATLGRIVNYGGQDYLITPDDYMKEGYRNAIRQEYNLSVAGGGEKSNFFASIGYLDNKGITYNSDMTRFTSRLKADYQAKPWLKTGGNLSYTKFNYNSLSDDGSSNSTGNIWAFTSQIAPIYPLYVRDGQGNKMVDADGITMMDYGDGMNAGLGRPFIKNANPLLANQLNTRNSEGNAFGASGFADISFLKYFKFTVNASTTIDESRGTTVTNPYYGQFASSGGTLGKSHTRSSAFNTQQILNYTQEFAGRHHVNVMLGHEYYDRKYAYLYGSKQKMFSQDNKELIAAVIDNQNAYSYTTEYNNEGFFSRVQYDDNNTFFLSASFRRDASSKFAPEYRWGNFWSVGAAYVISKERFMENVKWIDLLKLKASYGSQGNDNIDSYLYTDTYDIVPSDGEVAVSFSGKGKRDITWETNTNFNAGVEFTLFNGVLDGSIEYFNRKTTDMLFAFNVAPSLGYTYYYDNVGDMRNYGMELGLTVNIINKKDFNWSINANATKVKNRILYLHDDVKTLNIEGYDGYNSGSYFIGEGLPLYTRYLKKYAGVDSETGQSLWYKYKKDDDGNPTKELETTANYSEGEYFLADSPIPDWYGGFGTSFYWKGIDFSINFSYQIGGKAYDSAYATFMSSPSAGSTGSNFHKDLLKAWTSENTSSNIPRFQYNDLYNGASSDRFLTNASYLNIENINLGYTLPSKWTSKVGIQSLRIYAAAENVFYWSVRQGFDPRNSFTGNASFASYLPIRTISGGITLKF